jgi:hypothetical protein
MVAAVINIDNVIWQKADLHTSLNPISAIRGVIELPYIQISDSTLDDNPHALDADFFCSALIGGNDSKNQLNKLLCLEAISSISR